MKFAKRMDQFGEGIFSRLLEIKKQRLEKGEPVIDLSVGTPNIPPAEHIRKALCEAASDEKNYIYAIYFVRVFLLPKLSICQLIQKIQCFCLSTNKKQVSRERC